MLQKRCNLFFCIPFLRYKNLKKVTLSNISFFLASKKDAISIVNACSTKNSVLNFNERLVGKVGVVQHFLRKGIMSTSSY